MQPRSGALFAANDFDGADAIALSAAERPPGLASPLGLLLPAKSGHRA